MGAAAALAVVALFWVAVYALHVAARALYGRAAVQAWLEARGIQVRTCLLLWETRRFNTRLGVLGGSGVSRRVRRRCRAFYCVGVAVALLLLCVVPIALVVNAARICSRWVVTEDLSAAMGGSVAQVTPLLPGVTFPLSKGLYLFLSVALSVAIHEAGHGLAAGAEGVRTLKVGVALAAVMPSGYVRTDDILEDKPILSRLRVYCAGIWHNVLLCLVVYFVAAHLWLPLAPFYRRETGVVVTSVSEDSALSAHISLSDVIVGIDGYTLTTSDDWYTAIETLAAWRGTYRRDDLVPESNGTAAVQPGYCVASSRLTDAGIYFSHNRGNERGCCAEYRLPWLSGIESNEKSAGQLCLVVGDRDVENLGASTTSTQREAACIAARTLQTAWSRRCNDAADCRGGAASIELQQPPFYCVHPVLLPGEAVARLEFSQGRMLTYAGPLLDLYTAIEPGDFVLRDPLRAVASLSEAVLAVCLQLPQMARATLSLILAVSASLGALNAAPITRTDGQHVINALSGAISYGRIAGWVVTATTAALAVNVLLSLASLSW